MKDLGRFSDHKKSHFLKTSKHIVCVFDQTVDKQIQTITLWVARAPLLSRFGVIMIDSKQWGLHEHAQKQMDIARAVMNIAKTIAMFILWGDVLGPFKDLGRAIEKNRCSTSEGKIRLNMPSFYSPMK